MLATIRTDAPIHFVLPEKVWREDIDMKKVESLFVQFEFRTLAQKFAESLSLTMSEKPTTDASPEEIFETGLLLWVVDSNKTNPTLDDILSYTRQSALPEAKNILEKTIKDQGLSTVYDKIEKPLVPIVKKMK